MPMINPFTQDAYNLVALSDAISILPNKYGRLNEMGLFIPKPQTSRAVFVEMKNGVLNLLPTRPVGAPGTVATRSTRNLRPFLIPHIPHEDTILPSEYGGIRAFGTENQYMTLAGVLAEHLQTARDKFEITWEYLKWGALNGLILDADGALIYNLFSEFGIQQKTVDFALDDDTTDVKAKTFEVARHIEDNAMGEIFSYIHAMVSSEFFDALVSHPNVEKFWVNFSDAQNIRGDMRRRFVFGTMAFEEHRGNVDDMTGTNRRFITASEGISFPVGTTNVFRMYYAPAEFLETVNTPGRDIYAKQKIRDFEKGIDLWFESNPLPMCTRPALLVRIKA